MAERDGTVGKKSKLRSKVGNGTELLPDIDGRSSIARRIRELLAEFIVDMGGDPSGAKLAIAKRASTLISWCESAESKMANEGDLDIATYTTAINTLRRLLTDIGLERRARDITDDLHTYLKRGKAA